MLSGGGCRISGFESAFQGKTNLPVELLNPLERVTASNRFDPDTLARWGPSLGVAVGLAMRRVDV